MHFECPAQAEEEKSVKSPVRRGMQLPAGVEVNPAPLATETATEAVNIDHGDDDSSDDDDAIGAVVPSFM